MSVQSISDLVAANGSFQRREFASVAEEQKREAAIQAKTEEAQKNWTDPAWHRQEAEAIAESLDWGFKNDNVFSQFIQTSFVGKNEQVIVKERRGLKVFYTHRAGEIDESTMSDETFELTKDTLGWHVSEFEDDVEANYGRTIAELVPLARLRQDTEVNRRIFQMVQEAVPEGSEFYEDATAGLTAQILNRLIAEVGDAPQPSNVSIARPLTIVGRANAINQIFDLPGYTPDAQEELRKTGRLGVYRGANIVQLKNWTDEDNAPYVPEDELFIFGGYAGRFAFYGGEKVKTWTENKTDFRHYKSRRDLGGAIFHPEALRRVSLNL